MPAREEKARCEVTRSSGGSPLQLSSPEDGQESGEHRKHYQSTALEDSPDVEPVAPQRRIVLEAAEQDSIQRGAHLAVSRLHQRQLEIARPILNAVQVARYLAGRGEHKNHRRVGILFRVLVVGVSKADAFREGANLICGAGGEGPGWITGLLSERLQVPRLPLRGEARCFAGIDA